MRSYYGRLIIQLISTLSEKYYAQGEKVVTLLPPRSTSSAPYTCCWAGVCDDWGGAEGSRQEPPRRLFNVESYICGLPDTQCTNDDVTTVCHV